MSWTGLMLITLVFIGAGYTVADGHRDAPSILWFKTYGQTGQDDALALLTTGDGFIVGGMTESPDIGADDSWIKKIDPEGTTIFTRHYETKILDEARSIIQADDNTLVMGGATEPYGETYPKDAAIIKVDRDGNMIWNMSFGDPMLQETVEDIAKRPEGGYIFSGHVEDWRTGSMEALLVAINQTGVVEWYRKYPRGTGSDAQSVLVLDDGYLFSGYTDVSQNGDYQGWLAKSDKNGDIQWEKSYGESGPDAIHRIIPATDGGYLLVGEKTVTDDQKSDVWIIHADEAGKVIWEQHYGGTSDDKGFDASTPASGGYLVTGWTESYGAGKRDAWVIRLDTDGTPWWSKTIGGPENDLGSSADELPGGEIIVAGLTDSYGAGMYDAMVVKLTKGEL